ncbi:O-antigen ligase family protein [Kitasatospora sp. NPDC048365]|uniref:O-antigen ligase family protein n=1 Tax=Kitasatospora sp. NPDC048365 TaxID=3364050 RepID=UPI003715111E
MAHAGTALSPEAVLRAAAALAAAVAVVLVFVRFPTVGIAALVGGQAWQVALRGQVPVVDAGITLYPLDVLTVCAALAAAVSLVRRPVRPHLGHAALVLLALLVFASLVRGVSGYGVQPAGNEARVYFLHVLGAAGYAATVRPDVDLDRTLHRVWTVLACFYGVVAILWWSRVGIGSNSDYVLIAGQRVNSRPVDAASAFVIAQAAVMLLCRRHRTRVTGWLVGPLLLLVVLLQHRTVWLAALVMIAGWLLFRPGHGSRKAAGIGAAVLLAATAALAGSFAPDAGLTRSLASSATNEDTMAWRVASWRLLVDRPQGLHDWLFGLPFGSGFTRLLYGRVVEEQPHNYYLHLLLRVGLVGLIAAVALVVAMLLRTDHRSPNGLLRWLATAGIACFCLTYALPFEQSLLIGLLLRPPDASPTEHRPASAGVPALLAPAAR